MLHVILAWQTVILTLLHRRVAINLITCSCGLFYWRKHIYYTIVCKQKRPRNLKTLRRKNAYIFYDTNHKIRGLLRSFVVDKIIHLWYCRLSMLFGCEGKEVCVKETKQQIYTRWGMKICPVTVSFTFHEKRVGYCPSTVSLHFLLTLTSSDNSKEFFDRLSTCGNKL